MTGPLLLLAVVALLLTPLLVTFLVAFLPAPSECWWRTKSTAFAVAVFFFACLVCCLGAP